MRNEIEWTKGKRKFLFPYRIKFRIIQEAKKPPKISYSIKPNLIDDITFIADKGKTWNQYLQVSIIRITKEDFDVIYKAIKRSDE